MSIAQVFRLIIPMAVSAGFIPMTAIAQVPPDRPFAIRGVELGITLEAFKQFPIPNDGDRYFDQAVRCTNDSFEQNAVTISSEDKADGIVDCQWHSKDSVVTLRSQSEQWVDIGTGKGIPTFRFIKVGDDLRLFRVGFYANTDYYPGILDALTRGYGTPQAKIEPFKTLSGSEFTSRTSIWRNALSSITLVERCGVLSV